MLRSRSSSTTRRNSNWMNTGAGAILRRVLMVVCLIQVVITCYLAFCIFTSAYSSVKHIQSIPQQKRPNDKANAKKSEGKKTGEFDIGEHEAAIILAQQEVKPNILEKIQVQWGEAVNSKGVAVNLPVVEMWGKAAIGSYLWRHILEGEETLDEAMPGAVIGQLQMPAFVLKYRSGPGVVPETVPQDVKHLILIVNGRTDEKVKFARQWLDFLGELESPPVVILVMLGNERCENQWVNNYLRPKGPVSTVLLTYDDPQVDQVVFHQWPLGVATYREFPIVEEGQIAPEIPRKYMCNLQATLHANTSRIELHKLMKDDEFISTHCHISVRESWLPNETPDSLGDYIQVLLQSDLTICPAGVNTETYRVYEAMSAGSTPIIEDVATSGNCDSNPWRLLKKHGPPVIWMKSWDQLPRIFAKERRYSKQYKALRRLRVSQWYEWFKLRMRDHFISVITSTLLRPD